MKVLVLLCSICYLATISVGQQQGNTQGQPGTQTRTNGGQSATRTNAPGGQQFGGRGTGGNQNPFGGGMGFGGPPGFGGQGMMQFPGQGPPGGWQGMGPPPFGRQGGNQMGFGGFGGPGGPPMGGFGGFGGFGGPGGPPGQGFGLGAGGPPGQAFGGPGGPAGQGMFGGQGPFGGQGGQGGLGGAFGGRPGQFGGGQGQFGGGRLGQFGGSNGADNSLSSTAFGTGTPTGTGTSTSTGTGTSTGTSSVPSNTGTPQNPFGGAAGQNAMVGNQPWGNPFGQMGAGGPGQMGLGFGGGMPNFGQGGGANGGGMPNFGQGGGANGGGMPNFGQGGGANGGGMPNFGQGNGGFGTGLNLGTLPSTGLFTGMQGSTLIDPITGNRIRPLTNEVANNAIATRRGQTGLVRGGRMQRRNNMLIQRTRLAPTLITNRRRALANRRRNAFRPRTNQGAQARRGLRALPNQLRSIGNTRATGTQNSRRPTATGADGRSTSGRAVRRQVTRSMTRQPITETEGTAIASQGSAQNMRVLRRENRVETGTRTRSTAIEQRTATTGTTREGSATAAESNSNFAIVPVNLGTSGDRAAQTNRRQVLAIVPLENNAAPADFVNFARTIPRSVLQQANQ